MSKRRVLVVDDDEDDYRLICEQLERCAGTEIEPVWASSLAVGLTALAQQDFHFCLVDLYLGPESGLSFIRAATKAGCRIPLILMTGVGNQEVDRAAQDAGAAYYVEKGALTAEQLERITRYCAGHVSAKRLQPTSAAARRVGKAPTAPSTDLPRILLIEDDEDDYLLTRDLLLEVFGSKLVLDWEPSHQRALDRIADGQHDVVIVDYRLGERNGLELVRDAIERGGTAPFIVLTGESSREIDLEAMRVGAMDYLVKGEITAPLLDRSIRYSIERHRAERRLADLAQLDQLTGLPNRYLLHDFLTRSLARADRQGHDVAVMLVDLDRFKPVNDVYGHGAGDRLLQTLADRLQQQVRAGDLVARLGGDEFIIVMTDVRDSELLVSSAQRFLTAIGQPVDLGMCEVGVGASIGIALYPTDADSLESLLVNADFAMYSAKEQRAGGLCFYTGEMRNRAGRRFSLERDLRQAVSRDELRLLFQPQIELTSGRLIGLEALVRWQHPEEGLISPGEFIPVAEESDLILGIGEWVMRTACAQLASWRAQGFPDIRIAVNLSARQLHHGELIQLVSGMLAEHSLPTHLLELEITESHILQRPAEALKLLGRLAEVGVRVALDDFGTGYSSLNHLRSFPGSSIKIDRSFICNICEKRNDAAIVRSLIEMAHDLDLKVVAEGVETPMQLDRLRAYGCDYVQGFLISKPLPADRISPDLLMTRLRHGTASSFAAMPDPSTIVSG